MCSNLKNILALKEKAFFHTIPTLKDSTKKPLNVLDKGKNTGYQQFLVFPHNDFFPVKTDQFQLTCAQHAQGELIRVSSIHACSVFSSPEHNVLKGSF